MHTELEIKALVQGELPLVNINPLELEQAWQALVPGFSEDLTFFVSAQIKDSSNITKSQAMSKAVEEVGYI